MRFTFWLSKAWTTWLATYEENKKNCFSHISITLFCNEEILRYAIRLKDKVFFWYRTKPWEYLNKGTLWNKIHKTIPYLY